MKCWEQRATMKMSCPPARGNCSTYSCRQTPHSLTPKSYRARPQRLCPVKAALESSVRYLAADLAVHDTMSMRSRLSPSEHAPRQVSNISVSCSTKSAVARRAATWLRSVKSNASRPLLASNAGRALTGSTIYADAGFHVVNPLFRWFAYLFEASGGVLRGGRRECVTCSNE